MDPNLIDSDDEEIPEISTAKFIEKPVSKLDPFNLSNDHLYEQAREAKFRIRQTFGSIEVFHSGPAKALQLPFVRFPMSISMNELTPSTRRPLPRAKHEHGDDHLSNFLLACRCHFRKSSLIHRLRHEQAKRR